MIVKIFATERTGSREAGRLCLDGGVLFVEPATPEDRLLLENILHHPILVTGKGEAVQVSADQEPRRFLENLCREYSGSYLRASKPLFKKPAEYLQG